MCGGVWRCILTLPDYDRRYKEVVLRRVWNPPNPFASEHREWLEEPPKVELTLHEEEAKSIVAHNDSPDISFDWSVNPYRGCQHGCSYCYARRTHEYLGFGAGTDFESQLVVKVNAAELLRQEITRAGWRGEAIAFSGVTDCYQPVEAVYGLTGRCLDVCVEVGNPVAVVTKSFLVVRDIERLRALSGGAGVQVYVSIPFADAGVSRLVEAGAPMPARRLEALRRLSAAGIRTGVLIAPVIPGLNDREIPRIVELAAAAGARSASFAPLRLPGNVRGVFLERLRREMPERAGRVESRILEMREGRWNRSDFVERMRASGAYWGSVVQLFERSLRRFGLAHGRGRDGVTRCLPEGGGSRTEGGVAVVRQLPLFGEG